MNFFMGAVVLQEAPDLFYAKPSHPVPKYNGIRKTYGSLKLAFRLNADYTIAFEGAQAESTGADRSIEESCATSKWTRKGRQLSQSLLSFRPETVEAGVTDWLPGRPKASGSCIVPCSTGFGPVE